MLKTGIKSSGYFGLYDYGDGLKKIKKHGFDCIDFQGFLSPDGELYKLGERDFRNYFISLKSAAQSAGIEIWQTHATWQHDERTKQSRDEFLKKLEMSIKACGIMGCRYLVIHPSMPYGWDEEPSVKTAYDYTIERLEKLLPSAQAEDVVLCVENMPFKKGHSFSSVSEIKSIIKRFNDPYIKACFDTGHCNVSGENHYETIKLLGSDLVCLHVHDDFGRQDRHLIPFQGAIDWHGFAKGLKEIGFSGCISLETIIETKTPEPMKEQMQIALSGIARYLAEYVEQA